MSPKEVTYAGIFAGVEEYSAQCKDTIPPLLEAVHEEAIWEYILENDAPLVDSVKAHVDGWPHTTVTHNFDHLRWVAIYSAYAALDECASRGIEDDKRLDIVRRSWRLGLLHDIERYDRSGHERRGAHVAGFLLEKLGIEDRHLPFLVLIHDETSIDASGDPSVDIPFFSVFAADHLQYGFERERTIWEEWQRKGITPDSAISDYQYLITLAESPNFGQTRFGREVALRYVEYGIGIARHVESVFGPHAI